MDKKLTLSLDKSIIEKAKGYAKANGISLSKLIESYLSTLTQRENNAREVTPLVESLSGVINLNADFDLKDAYTNHLIHKYK
jgi:hypothetical protein